MKNLGIKLIVPVLLGLLIYPLGVEAGPREELFGRLLSRVFVVSTDQTANKSWFHITNRAVTDVMTLEMQMAFRRELQSGLRERASLELYGQIYPKLLGNVRARLMQARPTRNFLTKIDRLTEQKVSREIEQIYEEMADVFKTPDDLIAFIERNPWAKEIVSQGELELIRAFRLQFHEFETPAIVIIENWLTIAKTFEGVTLSESDEMALQSLKELLEREGCQMASIDDVVRLSRENQWLNRKVISESQLAILQRIPRMLEAHPQTFQPFELSEALSRRTFRNLRALTQDQLFESIENLSAAARAGAPTDKQAIELIFRNLTQEGQELWTVAEAELAMKVQFSFWRIWRNFKSRNPAVKKRWFLFWKKARKLVLPTRMPKKSEDIAEFFRELQTLLEQAVEPAPRVISLRPDAYIARTIEQRAQVLAAEFEMIRSLQEISPELGLVVTRKEAEREIFEQYARVLEEKGLQGLIREIQTTEGGWNLIPWRWGVVFTDRKLLLGFARLPIGLQSRLRGQHARRLIGYHLMAIISGLTVYQVGSKGYAAYQETKALRPPRRYETYPGDKIGGEAVRGGIRPQTDPDATNQDALDIATEETVSLWLAKKDELESLEPKLAQTQDPHEQLFLRERISKIKAEMDDERLDIVTYNEGKDERISHLLRSMQPLLEKIDYLTNAREELSQEISVLNPQEATELARYQELEALFNEMGGDLKQFEMEHESLERQLDTLIDEIIETTEERLKQIDPKND